VTNVAQVRHEEQTRFRILNDEFHSQAFAGTAGAFGIATGTSWRITVERVLPLVTFSISASARKGKGRCSYLAYSEALPSAYSVVAVPRALPFDSSKRVSA